MEVTGKAPIQDKTLMPTEKFRKLHDNLIKRDGFNVPYEQFEKDMQDENKLKTLHSNLSKQSDFTVPYDQFKTDMFQAEQESAIVQPEQPQLIQEHVKPLGKFDQLKVDYLRKTRGEEYANQEQVKMQTPKPAIPGWDAKSPLDKFTTGVKSGWEGTKGGLKYTGAVMLEGLDKIDGEEDWQYDNRLFESAKENFKAAPRGEGIWYQLGSFTPQMMGIAAAAASAPITGGTSLSAAPAIIGGANIGTLVASAAGSSMHEYDQYNEQEGKEGSDLARIGVGIGSGAAEYLAERIGLDRYMPKGSMSKAFTKFLSTSGKDVAEEIGKNAVSKNPSLKGFLKKTALNMGEEGSEESLTEAGNILIETLYKDDKDEAGLGEVVTRLKDAFGGGALMGGVLSPITYGADAAYQKKMQPITTATIEGQQFTVNNPEDLGIEGKPIFAKDAEGNIKAVPNFKATDPITQTQREIDQAQQVAADKQALMNGISDPNAQILSDETYDEGARVVDFSNGQAKIIYNGREVIANDVNEKDNILNSITDFQKLPQPKVSESGEIIEPAPERKVITQKIGNTDIDIIEGEEFDEVVPSEKVPLEKAYAALEKKFKDNKKFKLEVDKVQVEEPGETKYDEPIKKTVIKSIKIVPVAQNVNNPKANTENVPDTIDQLFDNQLPIVNNESRNITNQGEVELRNVQSRPNLSPEQRREQMLSEIQDVAEEQKIYLQGAIDKAYPIGNKPSSKAIKERIDQLHTITPNAAPVEIIADKNGLPKMVKNGKNFSDNVQAVWFNNKIYILANKVGSIDEVIGLWIHENGIHNGLRNIIPSGEFIKFMGKVYDSFVESGKGNPMFQRIIDRVNEDYSFASKAEKAEEFLAYLSEKVVNEEDLTPMEQSLWIEYLGMFRDFLRRLFNFNSQLLSEKQIVEITRFAVQSNFQENELASSNQGRSGEIREGEQRNIDGSKGSTDRRLQDSSNRGGTPDIRSGRILDRNSTRLTVSQSNDIRFQIVKYEALNQLKEDLDKITTLGRYASELKALEESKVGKKVAERKVIMRQISGYKQGYKAGVAEKRLTLQVIQRNIVKYANDNMNYDDATRFEITQLLTALNNANTPTLITKAFDKIDELASRGLKRKLMNRIARSIKSASPKLQSGKPTGKVSPESYQAISNIKRLIEMTPDQYDNYLELIADDDVESIALASTFGNLKEKSIDETFEALKILNSILSDGRTWYKDKIEGLKTRHKQLIERAVNDITGGKGIQSTQNIRSENGVVDKNSQIKEFLGKNQSFEWLLDLISNNKKDRTGWGFMQDHFGDLANKSENLESKGLRESIELVNKKAFEIFGKEKSALAKIFGENSRVIKKSGVTYATNDGRKEIPLSQNEAYKRWMEMSDPTLFPTFEKMGWDSQSLTEIEKFLNPKVLAWAKWQVSEFFPEYYKRVNDVYKKMYYVDLPFNPSYSGFLKREKTSVGDKEDTMLRPNTLIGSVANSSLKSRIKNVRDIVLQDGDQALAKHIAEMEHFMAWAETIREIRAVLSSDAVQDAIKKEHGNNIRTVLNERINSLVRGGVDRGEVNYLVDWVRKNYVTSALGVNISLTPKQMTAMFSYLNDISIMDYIKGAAEFFSDPAKAIETLSDSEFIKRRYKKGWTHEIEAAMKKNNPHTLAGTKSTINSIRDALMLPVMLGDKFAVYSGYPVYAKFYKQFKAENPTASEQAARDFAINKFERVTKRTQQSSDVSDTSRFQETSFGKVFMMFKNAQQQYFRYEMAAINNLIKGKGNAAENAKIILITHVVLPVIFQMVANWFTDEDDDKENKRLLRAALLGPIDGLMIAGDIVGYGLEKMMGERWSYSASPMLDTVQDLGNSITQMVKYINEPYPENQAEELQKALDFAIKFTSSTMTGIPYEPVKRLYNKATGEEKKTRKEEDVREIISKADKYLKFVRESAKRDDNELYDKLMSDKTALDAVDMLVISDKENGRKSYDSIIANYRKYIKYWRNIKTDEAKMKVDEYELMLENIYNEILEKYSDVEFPSSYKLNE